MAAAFDIWGITFDALWDAFLARSEWAAVFRERNRIRPNPSTPTPLKTNWQDGDFPQFILAWGRTGTIPIDNDARTFGQSASATAPRVERFVRECVASITYADAGKASLAAPLAETRACLSTAMGAIATALEAAAPATHRLFVKQFGPVAFTHDELGRATSPLPGFIEQFRGQPRRPTTLLRWPVIIEATGPTPLI